MKVFISYRRNDTGHAVAGLTKTLRDSPGVNSVFKDIDSMTPGVDFKQDLEVCLNQSNVVIVVVGCDWLDVKDRKGNRRLDNPEDPVAIEILLALSNSIPILPVLVDGAEMPHEEDVPEQLAPFCSINATPLRTTDYEYDLDRIMDALQTITGESVGIKPEPRRTFLKRASLIALGGTAVVAGGIYFPRILQGPEEQPAPVKLRTDNPRYISKKDNPRYISKKDKVLRLENRHQHLPTIAQGFYLNTKNAAGKVHYINRNNYALYTQGLQPEFLKAVDPIEVIDSINKTAFPYAIEEHALSLIAADQWESALALLEAAMGTQGSYDTRLKQLYRKASLFYPENNWPFQDSYPKQFVWTQPQICTSRSCPSPQTLTKDFTA